MNRTRTSVTAAALAFALSACSGAGTGSLPQNALPQAANAVETAANAGAAISQNGVRADASTPPSLGPIEALNAAGASIRDLSEEAQTDTGRGSQTSSGTCRKGIELYVPDKAGTPDSMQREVFWDAGCTKLARDSVRVFTPTSGSSENVTLDVINYSPAGAKLSERSAEVTFADATFGSNGFPNPTDGFDRNATSTLAIAGTRTILAGDEFVVSPLSNGSGTFCSDSAGYNAVGFPALGKTFGWEGGFLTAGTRTVNSDGSVTWNGTHTGTAYEAPIGSLSLVTGTPNTACPIVAPDYSLSGGTAGGSSTGALTATFDNGELVDLTLDHTGSRGSYAIAASTDTKLWPTNPRFITGTVTSGGKTIAHFAVNAFGDGTISVFATGTIYRIVDWIVVK
ncbi:MAG TPA: hypothetical protein VMF61_02940 [Candidatus Acidoferrales bacterium]|nr:hypothetical protein [Candidatus Acidoferrales bacterium]